MRPVYYSFIGATRPWSGDHSERRTYYDDYSAAVRELQELAKDGGWHDISEARAVMEKHGVPKLDTLLDCAGMYVESGRRFVYARAATVDTEAQ